MIDILNSDDSYGINRMFSRLLVFVSELSDLANILPNPVPSAIANDQ